MWLALLDALEAVKNTKKIESFAGVMVMAESVGLPSPGFTVEDEVRFILLYFTLLGVLSWFDEPGLSDLVILVSHSTSSHHTHRLGDSQRQADR